jgi:general secretion pathway protein M
MSIAASPTFARARHVIPPLIYGTLVACSLAAVISGLSSLNERRATIRAAEAMLAQLEGHAPQPNRDGRPPLGGAPEGSPFLEGATVNVAGAALLQRIAAAVTKVGGNVLSSQVELQKPEAKDGWVDLVVTCEMEPAHLQSLLYDLEAGMPFLFIGQLVVQAPITGVEQSKMRVLLTVSGQWWGGK